MSQLGQVSLKKQWLAFVVQSLNHVWLLVIPGTLQHASLPSTSLFPEFWSHSCPLSWWYYLTISSSAASFPFAFNLSHYQVFFFFFPSASALHIMWSNYWTIRFSIGPSNEHSGWISFMIDWLDLLAVQRTLKNLLQHHNSKASILWCSTFFVVQLLSVHDYWKNQSFDYVDLSW